MKKKGTRIAITVILLILVLGIYYYFALPAINIHAHGFWGAVLFLIALVTVIYAVRTFRYDISKNGLQPSVLGKMKKSKGIMAGTAAFVVVLVIFIVGSFLSSPIINASNYSQLLTVETGNFATDIEEADFNEIPILDKGSAELLGDRKMGSMVEMVSQFEVESDYTQINYQGKPVRVSPLRYASFIKWLTNRSEGIPAYMMIDMATQDVEVVKLPEGQGIKYSKSEYLNRYIYRHLRFKYPTAIFDDEIFFEVKDDGVPYWVVPVKKFNIGLFGGQTVGRVILCNAITGECTDYDVSEVPTWVDKVYSAELLTELFDYYGVLQNGYFNSILGQKDCLQATNGYNYIAQDDDVWVYTGVTSLGSDQSNVGFVLMNQRTMETNYYVVEGAIEDSAMSSAEGQVQNLGYQSTFPLLLNISGQPTYFMALKDGAGLVKKYAMVNVQKYQLVAIGDTVDECQEVYMNLMDANNILDAGEDADLKELTGSINTIAPVVIEGDTHYYLSLMQSEKIFDLDLTNDALIPIVTYQEGDQITLIYIEEDATLNEVTEIK